MRPPNGNSVGLMSHGKSRSNPTLVAIFTQAITAEIRARTISHLSNKEIVDVITFYEVASLVTNCYDSKNVFPVTRNK